MNLDITTVKTCRSCPYFAVEDMEHLMICKHPYWKDTAYSGCIITQQNRDSIPAKCPLRRGESVENKVIRLG